MGDPVREEKMDAPSGRVEDAASEPLPSTEEMAAMLRVWMRDWFIKIIKEKTPEKAADFFIEHVHGVLRNQMARHQAELDEARAQIRAPKAEGPAQPEGT